MDRRVVAALKRLPENNRFVRGLVSWVGFRQTAIEYERDERLAGETKYPLKRMIKLCLDGITSFSYKPLKLAAYLGTLLSLTGFLFLLYAIGVKLFTDTTAKGWASMISLQPLFNGVTLIILGIIGEYVGRIYDETKARPLYIVRECVRSGSSDAPKEPLHQTYLPAELDVSSELNHTEGVPVGTMSPAYTSRNPGKGA